MSAFGSGTLGNTPIPLRTVKAIQSICEHLEVAFITTDAEGTITCWNSTAEAIYGYPAESVVDRPIMDITVGPINESEAEQIMRNLSAGKLWFGRFVCRRADGSTTEVNVLDLPIEDELGRFAGVAGFSQPPGSQSSELFRQLDELRLLTQEIDDIRLTEQSRIGAVLHDQLSQVIAMTAIDLISSSRSPECPTTLSTDLGNYALRLQEVMELLKGICAELRPDWDQNAPPELSIQELVYSWSKIVATPVKLLIDPKVESADRRVYIVLMQVLREALANAERHSRATLVSIRIKIADELLSATIVDNGIGIASHDGFGIRLMRERARSVGGHLRIHALGTPSHGTFIEFVAPIAPPPPANP